MADIEIVKVGLKYHRDSHKEGCVQGSQVCPYITKGDRCFHILLDDALSAINEQQERIKVLEDEETAKNKPMKVVYDMNPMTRLPVSFCPICGYAVDRYAYGRNDLPQVFCPYCGQALDWKDGEQE